MKVYKSITFAKDFNMSFADFKDQYSTYEIFKKMHPETRKVELKKAYDIANTSTKTRESKPAIKE